MAAKISGSAPIVPGSVVQPIEYARKFHKGLPGPGHYEVKEVVLRKTGWIVKLDEALPPFEEVRPGMFQRVGGHPCWAFDIVKAAELGDEIEIPGLKEDLEHAAARFGPVPNIPPVFDRLFEAD